MKNKILFMITITLGLAPAIHAMEYSGPPDKEPSEKEEIIKIVKESEQVPIGMLKMISKDGHEFFVDTQVAQESPVFAAAISMKQQQGLPLIYQFFSTRKTEGQLSAHEIKALIQLLQLQRTTPRFKPEDIAKIDDIFEPLTKQEQSHLLDEALNYFELPIAAFYTAGQLISSPEIDDSLREEREKYFQTFYKTRGSLRRQPLRYQQHRKIADIKKRNIEKYKIEYLEDKGEKKFYQPSYQPLNDFSSITKNPNLQDIIMKYYILLNPDLPLNSVTFNDDNYGFSIQDLLDFNKLPEIKKGEHLLLMDENINDLTGIENIPHKENIGALFINQNRITTLPENIFSQFTNLPHLYLYDNDIRVINPNAFNGLAELEFLDLKNNKIKSMTKNILDELIQRMPKLFSLNLSGNPIPEKERFDSDIIQWQEPQKDEEVEDILEDTKLFSD